MDALVAFAAALLALRLAGLLFRRHRVGKRPEFLAWSAGLGAYAVAAAAIAWGEAAGWDGRAFRVYYAAGAPLPAPRRTSPRGADRARLRRTRHRRLARGAAARRLARGIRGPRNTSGTGPP